MPRYYYFFCYFIPSLHFADHRQKERQAIISLLEEPVTIVSLMEKPATIISLLEEPATIIVLGDQPRQE